MKTLCSKIFCLVLLAVISMTLCRTPDANAQTVTFDDQGYVHNAGLGRSIVAGNFTFSVVDQNLVIQAASEQIYYESSSGGNGFGGSGLIYVGDQFNFDDPYYFRIQVNDGSNRHLTSFYIYDYINAAGKDNISITVEGFRDNVKIGEQDFNLIGDGISKQVLSMNAAVFSDVDEVRIRQLQPFAYGPEFPGVVFAFDQFVFDTALPVRLAAFTAQESEKGVDLSWKTASETISSYFGIERSGDAKNWHQIGRVIATGESGQPVYYGFRDEERVSGERFYRLKMVDVDSSFAYSKICHVAMSTERGIVLYPNPATTSVTLRTSNAVISSVELFDEVGKSVSNFQPMPGEMSLSLSNVPPGIYFLRLGTAGGVVETKKLVKAK